MLLFLHIVALTFVCFSAVAAVTLDISSSDSIKDAAKTVAKGLTSYYTGNQPGHTPGILPKPYFWWEAGAIFGSLIEYWHTTGDAQYNAMTSQAMVHQASPGFNFMPPNQTKDEGNDDQMFWAFSTMAAAEYEFPEPPYGIPSWISMAQAVWSSQQPRWDDSTCGGGLRWQILPFNSGYTYKNSITNAGFMNLGARLYAYTNNDTYADWVQSSWHWMESVGLISDTYDVHDGSGVDKNCTAITGTRWSYNAGVVLHTAAVMWNKTHDEIWKHRLGGVWNASSAAFFNKDLVMFEQACENSGNNGNGNCDTDQLSFKAHYSHAIAKSIKLAPWLFDVAQPFLAASGKAAAAQCTGGHPGTDCGTKWTNNGIWDGTTGVGQQMSALAILTANLIQDSPAPVNEGSGGVSLPNVTIDLRDDTLLHLRPIKRSDKLLAWTLTVFFVTWPLFGALWVPYFHLLTAFFAFCAHADRAQVARVLRGVVITEGT